MELYKRTDRVRSYTRVCVGENRHRLSAQCIKFYMCPLISISIRPCPSVCLCLSVHPTPDKRPIKEQGLEDLLTGLPCPYEIKLRVRAGVTK